MGLSILFRTTIITHTNTKPNLPEGFEFLSVKRNIIINKEKNDKKQYISLLLEADPSEKMIEKYLIYYSKSLKDKKS